MTDLIVALDGAEPLRLMWQISWMTAHKVTWFKIGPQAMCSPDWHNIISAGYWADSINIFIDLKLVDTGDTVVESVKRFADNNVAAISTYSKSATEAAMKAAEGTGIRIWQVALLSDSTLAVERGSAPSPSGIICPVIIANEVKGDIETICPGIRRPHDDYNGHVSVATPRAAVLAGATYAVVGRPIWASSDPVASAKDFQLQLRA